MPTEEKKTLTLPEKKKTPEQEYRELQQFVNGLNPRDGSAIPLPKDRRA